MARTQALRNLIYVAALLFLLLLSLQVRAQNLSHQMNVQIVPGLKMIKATDRIHFPANFPHKISFLLNKKIQIQSVDRINHVTLLHAGTTDSSFSEWGLELNSSDFTIEYSGIIDNPVVDDESNGLIAPQGAVLMGSTYWYPSFTGHLQTFQMTVKVPEGWMGLTQGQRVSSSTVNDPRFGQQSVTQWSEIYPQMDMDLVAGPFFEFNQALPDGRNVRVLLRKDDKNLAQNFLDVIPGYIEHYNQEISDYPYSDFTVIENFWETGLAFPSFTLLGPTVIRLPFLLTTSLPHEVLHNWWGNSVYVDYASGNWCEGLTTYMGDHWQQEVIGQADNYRRDTLMNYEDYVKTGNDFPVRSFKERMDSGSQAVGYGKSMMFFHMLKLHYSEDIFRKSLQNFYAENKFRVAGFKDIQASFEKISKKSLETEFDQWLGRTGAPSLTMTAASTWGNSVNFTLAQTQGENYNLNIPVEVTLANGNIVKQIVNLKEARQNFNFATAGKPVKIAVDPRYDVFRTLTREEHPATLSMVLGASQVHFYYPESQASAVDFIGAWKSKLAAKVDVQSVSGDLSLAGSGAIVLVGDDSRFAQLMKNQLNGQSFDTADGNIKILSSVYDSTSHSWAVVARSQMNPDQVILWLRWSKGMDPVDWAQRLLHYGKFSALVFEQKPNILELTWPVVNSPLEKNF